MKKILGILSILLGAFLTISSISQGFLLIKSLLENSQQGIAYRLGYIMGQGISLLLFLVAAFFLIKYGLKWLKAKKTPTE